MNLVFLAWKGHDKPRQKLALAKHCIKAFNGIWRFHGFIFANIVKDTIIAREVDLNTKILCLQKVSLLFYYLLNEILEALLSSIVFFFHRQLPRAIFLYFKMRQHATRIVAIIFHK